MHFYHLKELSITEEIIEQIDKLSWDGGWTIMLDGYPFFECTPGIEINETMADGEEENIMVSE